MTSLPAGAPAAAVADKDRRNAIRRLRTLTKEQLEVVANPGWFKSFWSDKEVSAAAAEELRLRQAGRLSEAPHGP